MKKIGIHLLAELSGCNEQDLNDKKLIEGVMLEACLSCRATVLESYFHGFLPQGVSGVVIIAESHVSIHTWPEYGYAALDVFTCGNRVDPKEIVKFIIDGLSAGTHSIKVVERGQNSDE